MLSAVQRGKPYRRSSWATRRAKVEFMAVIARRGLSVLLVRSAWSGDARKRVNGKALGKSGGVSADQMMLNGILQQPSIAFDPKGLHQIVLVECDCPRLEVQHTCDLLH